MINYTCDECKEPIPTNTNAELNIYKDGFEITIFITKAYVRRDVCRKCFEKILQLPDKN